MAICRLSGLPLALGYRVFLELHGPSVTRPAWLSSSGWNNQDRVACGDWPMFVAFGSGEGFLYNSLPNFQSAHPDQPGVWPKCLGLYAVAAFAHPNSSWSLRHKGPPPHTGRVQRRSVDSSVHDTGALLSGPTPVSVPCSSKSLSLCSH